MTNKFAQTVFSIPFAWSYMDEEHELGYIGWSVDEKMYRFHLWDVKKNIPQLMNLSNEDIEYIHNFIIQVNKGF